MQVLTHSVMAMVIAGTTPAIHMHVIFTDRADQMCRQLGVNGDKIIGACAGIVNGECLIIMDMNLDFKRAAEVDQMIDDGCTPSVKT